MSGEAMAIGPVVIRSIVLSLAVLGLLFLFSACRDGSTKSPVDPPLNGDYPADWPRPDYPRTAMTLGGVDLTVEVAADSKSRRYGMMFVQEMPEDWGMMFIYPEKKPLGFWMRNTRISLDIAFIADLESGARIVNVHSGMVPGQESPNYPSLGAIRMALELPNGWLERHGVKAGDSVDLPEALRTWPSGTDPVFQPNIPIIDP